MSPLSVVPNRRPFAPAALPAFFATMGASDSQRPAPSSSLFRLVGGCAQPQGRAPTVGSPWLPRRRSVRLDTAIHPGWASAARLLAGDAVACWRLETIGPLPRGHFGTRHLHGRHHPLPLHLACFRAYASSASLPPRLQGWIPGPWLAATRAGLPPARLRGIAKPQPRPDPVVT